MDAAKQHRKKIHIFPQQNEPQELLHGSMKQQFCISSTLHSF